MLEADANKRPSGLSTIYIIDVNLTALQAQMREIDAKLKASIDAGNLTLEVREPTQSLLGALIIGMTDYSERLDRALRVISLLAQGLGLSHSDVEIDLGSRQIGFNIEMYQSSISHQQRSFDVSDLPA